MTEHVEATVFCSSLPAWKQEENQHAVVEARRRLAVGDRKGLEEMAEHPVWRNWRSTAGRSTWLHMAPGLTPHADVVLPFLLAQGLDLEVWDRFEATPLLHTFCVPRSHRSVWWNALLDAGANAHVVDTRGRSGWYGALRSADKDVSKHLVDRGVCPTSTDLEGVEAMVRFDVLEEFWKVHGDPSQEDRDRIFMNACARGSWALVKGLTEKGLDSEPMADPHRALLLACSRSGPPPPLLRWLMEKDADPGRAFFDETVGHEVNAWQMLDRQNKSHLIRTLSEGQRVYLEKQLEESANPPRKKPRM